MKHIFIVGIWFLLWIAHYYQISKYKLTLNELVGFNYKKWNLYQFFSFGIPAYMVMHVYTKISFLNAELPNLLINFSVMACLFWGLDQLPKMICLALCRLVKKA